VVHKKGYGELVEKLAERAKNLRVGDGLDESVEMGPLINEAAVKKIAEYVQIGRDEGASLLCGGVRLTKGEFGRGNFFAPTIFSDVDPGMRLAQEEIFGPVLSVIPCDSLDQAIEIGNGVKYGLSSAIYTQDVNKAFIAMRDLFTGIFYVNSSTIGAEVQLPFGGTKQTGNGHREAADTALDIFSEWKAVYVDFSGKLQKAQIDS
jgi:aldehyde dehydrogenase (NAD+)